LGSFNQQLLFSLMPRRMSILCFPFCMITFFQFSILCRSFFSTLLRFLSYIVSALSHPFRPLASSQLLPSSLFIVSYFSSRCFPGLPQRGLPSAHAEPSDSHSWHSAHRPALRFPRAPVSAFATNFNVSLSLFFCPQLWFLSFMAVDWL